MQLNIKVPNRFYESVVILHPDMTEEQQKEFFRKSRDTIKSFSGEINHLDTWGKRRIANPIKKLKVGLYFHMTFEAQPACIGELERTMRINERVLRFMNTRLDERTPLSKHVEAYREVLEGTLKREQEREAKFQAKKAQRSTRDH